MERDEFLSKLSLGVLAVCGGCSLVGCSSNSAKGDNPTPNPPTPGTGTILSADLASELSAVGSSKIAGGVILARIGAGNVVSSFTAVQVACTHEGTSIGYSNTESLFVCPNHGSKFNQSGQVVVGPALTSLKKYTVNITGSQLTVVA